MKQDTDRTLGEVKELTEKLAEVGAGWHRILLHPTFGRKINCKRHCGGEAKTDGERRKYLSEKQKGVYFC